MVHHEKIGRQVVSAKAETIAAIATPSGRGGVGIVRISGPAVCDIAQAVLGSAPKARVAELHRFYSASGDIIDSGIALFFPGPHSFTGEDVLELQGHGGPVVMDMLLSEVLSHGARLARPGEFSERAFLNDKIDLAQAEAIADLIDSASQQAARMASRSLQGVFSEKLHSLVDKLVHLRMYVESAIDFPEEEIDFLADGTVIAHLNEIQTDLNDILRTAAQGCLLQEGMTVVIAGQPNAGKSTLLNSLTGRESAIVTEIPGTTRDILREYIHIDGMPLHVVDTAGLRESEDIVELEGISRAWGEINQADRILLVIDDGKGITNDDEQILDKLSQDNSKLTIVRNKIDISGASAAMKEGPMGTELYLSARQGEGMDILLNHLKDCMGYQSAGEGGFIARRRHLDALQRVQKFVDKGQEQLQDQGAGELLAEDLRQAQQAVSEITGEFTNEDLLDKIFSSFCIGK